MALPSLSDLEGLLQGLCTAEGPVGVNVAFTYNSPVNDLRHASGRILADLDYEIEFEGQEKLRRLSPRKRIDLLLFHQESLINIIRHSGATRVHIRLAAVEGEIIFTVSDNGRGLDGQVPASLKRRARLLGAEVEVGPAGATGARIVLRLKNRRFGFRK
jgi:signal transduction histidine kinase